MRSIIKLAILGGLLTAGAAFAQSAPGEEALPEGPGRAATVRICSTCHSLEVVTQVRRDAQAWADVVQMMRDRGASGTDEEMAQITAYLAKSFGPQ